MTARADAKGGDRGGGGFAFGHKDFGHGIHARANPCGIVDGDADATHARGGVNGGFHQTHGAFAWAGVAHKVQCHGFAGGKAQDIAFGDIGAQFQRIVAEH